MADVEAGAFARFEAIRRSWNAAEGVIKEAELVAAQVSVPAIKELRYAGRSLVDALDELSGAADATRLSLHLENARLSCMLATHDAVDAALAKMLVETEWMVRRIGYAAILRVEPEFNGFVRRLNDAKHEIAQARRERGSRALIYEDLAHERFPGIVAEYNHLRSSQPIMRAAAGQARLWRILGLAGAVAGVLGAAAAILA